MQRRLGSGVAQQPLPYPTEEIGWIRGAQGDPDRIGNQPLELEKRGCCVFRVHSFTSMTLSAARWCP